MSHLHPVYAPDGEFFEVTAERLSVVVLQHGWSQTKPDPNAEPAVKTVDGAQGWRSSDDLVHEDEDAELEEDDELPEEEADGEEE